ncbi:MAG: DNA-processing protein DprA [Asgard group archaeon]|nr:DNA-processing protein DprA [Asgard group archaeon]
MSDKNMIKWLKLCNIKGVGPRKIIKLFDYFSTIDAIWEADKNALLRSRVFNESAYYEWEKLKNASNENFEKILIECKQNNIEMIPLISNEYPNRLKLIPNPPVNLFLQGKKELLKVKKVAIVGSRSSDEKSKIWAHNNAIELVKNGLCVVSGGAIGIDYEAHKGALEASGETICVMGPGLLRLFPEQHIPLFNEIRKKGLLISENLPSFRGSKFALLQRNRITSGLSDALISVTASSGGGVMTQLRHAHEQRITIFCPKFDYKFSPIEGLKEVKQKYKITEIENILPILEIIKKNNLSNLLSAQSKLF